MQRQGLRAEIIKKRVHLRVIQTLAVYCVSCIRMEATMSQATVSEVTGSHDWDYRWQQVFALSGLVGVVLCLLSWEGGCPQPPDFAMSGPHTAQFDPSH